MANLSTFLEMQDRAILLGGLDGDDRDFVKDALNDAAEDWHDRHDWPWARAEAFIQTQAPYSTGTISVASDVVTLSGGTWPTDAAGMKLALGYGEPWYTVESRDSGTQVTLDRAWVGTAPSGDTYVLFNDIVALPSDFGRFLGPKGVTLHDDNGQPIHPLTEGRFVDWEHRSATGKPDAYAHYHDKSDGTKRIILGTDIPDAVYALRLIYKPAYTLMSDDGDTPFGIERRWRKGLVYGALAQIYEMPDRVDTNLRDRYASYFESELAKAWQIEKRTGQRVTHLRPFDHGLDVGHRYVRVSDE